MEKAVKYLDQTGELEDVRLLLRYAAQTLGRTQRAAILGFMEDRTDAEIGRELGLRRSAIFMSKRSALRKMRARLEKLGIRSASQLL